MPSLSKFARLAVLGFALAALVPSARAADLDNLAPADAEAVLVIDIHKLLASKAIKMFGDKEGLKKEIERAFELPEAAALKAAGLDPLRDFTRVTVTVSNGWTDPEVTVVVRGNFDIPKLEKTIEDTNEMKGQPLFIWRKGGRTYYDSWQPGGRESTGTFIGKDAFVLGSKDRIKELVAGEKVWEREEAKLLRKATDKVGGDATAFFAFTLTNKLAKEWQKMVHPGTGQGPPGWELFVLKSITPKVEAFVVSATVNDAIDVKLTITSADAETAKGLHFSLPPLIRERYLKRAGEAVPDLKPLTDALSTGLKTSVDGTACNISFRLTEDLLKKLPREKK